MAFRFALICLYVFLEPVGAELFKVTSEVKDKTVAQAVGDYTIDGSAYGYPRYKLVSTKLSRYLYRSPKGTWSITGSETNIEKSKGTIVSSKSAETPVGLTPFKYYSAGSWNVDTTFSITEKDSKVNSFTEKNMESLESVARKSIDQEKVSEKKDKPLLEKKTQKKADSVPKKEDDRVVEKKEELLTAKNGDTAVKSVVDNNIESVIEQKQSIVEKQDEPVAEKKKTEAVVEKRDEPLIEKKDEAVVEKRDEPLIEKKDEAVVEKKDEPVIEKKAEAIAEKKKEPVAEKNTEAVMEKKNEPLAEKKKTGAIVKKKEEVVVEKRDETVETVDMKNDESLVHEKIPAKVQKINPVVEKKVKTLIDNKVPLSKESCKSTGECTNDGVGSLESKLDPMMIGAGLLVAFAVIAVLFVVKSKGSDVARNDTSSASISTENKTIENEFLKKAAKKEVTGVLNEESETVTHNSSGKESIFLAKEVVVENYTSESLSTDSGLAHHVIDEKTEFAEKSEELKLDNSLQDGIPDQKESKEELDEIEKNSGSQEKHVTMTTQQSLLKAEAMAVGYVEKTSTNNNGMSDQVDKSNFHTETVEHVEIKSDAIVDMQGESGRVIGITENEAQSIDEVCESPLKEPEEKDADEANSESHNENADIEDVNSSSTLLGRESALKALRGLSLRYRQVFANEQSECESNGSEHEGDTLATVSTPPKSVTRRTSIFISDDLKGSRSNKMKKMDAKWLSSMSTHEEEGVHQLEEDEELEFMVAEFKTLVSLLEMDNGFIAEFIEMDGLDMLAQSLCFIVEAGVKEATYSGGKAHIGLASSSVDQRRYSYTSPISPLAGGITAVMSPAAIQLQFLILTATLTVLDTSHGLEWALSNVEALSKIFIAVQKSGQRADMGQAYKFLTDLCYTEEQYRVSGRRMFVEVLERLGELDDTTPKYDAICRLLLDKESSWSTKIQALRTFDTLTQIHEDGAARDSVREEISKSLHFASHERDQHLMRSRHWLEATTQETPVAKRRNELTILWNELMEVSGSSGLDQCLSKCSLNPALLSLRQDAVETIQQMIRFKSLKEDNDEVCIVYSDSDVAEDSLSEDAATATKFIDLLDIYERYTIRDQLDLIIASDEVTVSSVIASLPPIGNLEDAFSPLSQHPTNAADLIASLTTPEDRSVGKDGFAFEKEAGHLQLRSTLHNDIEMEVDVSVNGDIDTGSLEKSDSRKQSCTKENTVLGTENETESDEILSTDTTRTGALEKTCQAADSANVNDNTVSANASTAADASTDIVHGDISNAPAFPAQATSSANVNDNTVSANASTAADASTDIVHGDISNAPASPAQATSSANVNDNTVSANASTAADASTDIVHGDISNAPSSPAQATSSANVNDITVSADTSTTADVSACAATAASLESETKKDFTPLVGQTITGGQVLESASDVLPPIVSKKAKDAESAPYLSVNKEVVLDSPRAASSFLSSSPTRSKHADTKRESYREKDVLERERKERAREAQEIEELRRKLAVYKKLHPMSEDEMKWKQNVLDTSINTFVVAETEEEKAQRLYTETMVQSDQYGLLLRLLKNHPALRLLSEFQSAEANSAATGLDKDTSFSPPSSVRGGKGGLMAAIAGRGGGDSGGGGKGGLMAAIAGRGGGDTSGGGGKGGLMAAIAGRGSGDSGGGGGKGGLMAAIAGRGGGDSGGGGKGGLMAAIAGRGGGDSGGGGEKGGLMAAIAGRGGGDTSGGGGKGGLMAALAGRGGGKGGGLAAALAGRGGGSLTGSRTKKSVGSLRKRVEKELVKAQAEVASKKARGGFSQDQNLICDALQAVLDVPGHQDVEETNSQVYATEVKKVAMMWYEKLESAQQRALEEEKRCQEALTTLSEEVEKWARRKLEAPNKDEVEREREKQWSIDNRDENEKALQLMRSFMPIDLPKLTIEELDARVASAHGGNTNFYTPQLIERLKSKKLLQWVVTHPDDIVRANFLMGAHKQSFEQLQDYDLIELRAVYAVVPQSFSPDADNAKRRWREAFVQVVKDRVLASKLKPQEDVRNEAYSYPTADSIEASRLKAVKLEESLNESRASISDVRERCEMRKREVDSAILQARDPEAKKQLGKEFLREQTAAAKKKLVVAQRELMACENKIKTLEKELTRSEHQRVREEEAFQKIEANNLFGKPIPPCFDANPVLLKQDNVVKKLTDEEEKALRALELQETLKKREQNKEDQPQDAPETQSAESSKPAEGLNFYNGERRDKSSSMKDMLRAEIKTLPLENEALASTKKSNSNQSQPNPVHSPAPQRPQRRSSLQYKV